MQNDVTDTFLLSISKTKLTYHSLCCRINIRGNNNSLKFLYFLSQRQLSPRICYVLFQSIFMILQHSNSQVFTLQCFIFLKNYINVDYINIQTNLLLFLNISLLSSIQKDIKIINSFSPFNDLLSNPFLYWLTFKLELQLLQV